MDQHSESPIKVKNLGRLIVLCQMNVYKCHRSIDDAAANNAPTRQHNQSACYVSIKGSNNQVMDADVQ